MATTLGTLVANNLITPAGNPLPPPVTDIGPIPLHALHRLYASALMHMYRASDYMAR